MLLFMTRINTIPVRELTDQHLMAEYRELPMIMASARRSNPLNYVPTTQYTLNKGHVKFFFNKKNYLEQRYSDLIKELKYRGFNIDPSSRTVDFSILDKFQQVNWQPNQESLNINRSRIFDRISDKPNWYRYFGKPLGK